MQRGKLRASLFLYLQLSLSIYLPYLATAKVVETLRWPNDAVRLKARDAPAVFGLNCAHTQTIELSDLLMAHLLQAKYTKQEVCYGSFI